MDTESMFTAMLDSITDIEIHDKWVSGALLHPGLRGLEILPDDLRADIKMSGSAQIGVLMRKVPLTSDLETVNRHPKPVIEAQLGNESFDTLRQWTSSLFPPHVTATMR